MSESRLKEIARDLLAFGSVPLYSLVLLRAVVGRHSVFVYQMLAAAIAILVLYYVIKDSNMHAARSLVAVVFTSLYYDDTLYTIFVSLIWVLLLLSAYYIKRNSGAIYRGIIVGVISSAAGYSIAHYLA